MSSVSCQHFFYIFFNFIQPNLCCLSKKIRLTQKRIYHIIIFFLRQQQEFHHRTGLFLNAVDTGGNDPGIVEDQAVTGAQIFRQILKDPMLQFAAVLVQDHQARAVSRLHRGLRDQFLGQIVIKIRSFHNYLRKSI